jgi:two-component system response regulator GlrR
MSCAECGRDAVERARLVCSEQMPIDVDDETEQLTYRADATRLALRRQPRLLFTDRAGAHDVPIAGRMVLGSGAGVDVVIDDATVSRLHAELEIRDDGLWITDLGSKNGTTVEGLRIGTVCMPDGARARVGTTELTVAYAAATAGEALWEEGRFGPLVGGSPVMRAMYARLARVAPTAATVLIHGETGTGKELVARAIHEASPRADKPYAIVDCGALPEDLLEGELFGHVKGAFTGALASRAGAFESADGGTVFLDEVGELPLSMQPKLLRVLESRTVRRLGENAPRHVDVRIVSATHRDLRTMVNAGTFREDLYFRLAVVPIDVPPLRTRASDIPELVEHFLADRGGGSASPDVLRELSQRPWLGNVRELRNFVERALALGAEEALALSGVPHKAAAAATGAQVLLPSPPLNVPFKDLREEWVDHLEREYLRGLLVQHQGNITAMAQAAGLDRAYVYRILRKHDLEVVRPPGRPGT